MVDGTLKITSPLNGYTNTFDDTRVVEMDALGIYSISVPQGGMDELNRQLQALFGLSFPATGRCVRASDRQLAGTSFRVALFGLQSDQCFLVAEADTTNNDNSITCELFEHLHNTLGNTAYLTNQSDSWAVLEIDGALTLPALERICMLDMGSFDTDSVARTVMEQLAIIIERSGDERVRLFSPRSSAGSFLHAVSTSLQNVAGSTTDA